MRVFILALIALAMSAWMFVAVAGEKADKSPAPAAKTEEAAKGDANAAPKNEMVERGWTKRCVENKKDEKKYCEAFQRLDMKEGSARVAEIAIGLPEKPDKKSAARGAVILPLGVLLSESVGMKVDDGKAVSFNVRFCTNGGCAAYINISKELLDEMKKSKRVTFFFKTFEGQNVNLVLTMEGFEKVLKELS